MNPDLNLIITAVSRRRGVTLERMTEKNHQWHVVHTRWLVFALAREFTDLTTTELGEAFNQHHTSILHGLKEGAVLRKQSAPYQRCYAELMAELSERFSVGV